MAWSENKVGGNFNTPTREFICDSKDDIINLPTNVPQGSSALIIETGAVYLKKSTNDTDEAKGIINGWQPL